VLRAIAVTVLAVHLFTMPPEGLAAAWAGQLEQHNAHARGLAQAMIMMAGPLGYIVGSLLVGRLVHPDLRRRLIRPFAVLAPLTLVPALAHPPAPVVALLAAMCGACLAGMVPASNGLYVQALPRQYRARANGVMQSGLQLVQGGTVMLTGALAAKFHTVPGVVGLWSVGGVLLMLVVSSRWPASTEFERTIERTQAANRAAEAAENGRGVPGGGAMPKPGMRTVESY
jgi:MFS family permease